MSPPLRYSAPATEEQHPVPKYQFMSDEWMAEARKIRDEYKDRASEIPHQLRMNLSVTDIPGRDSSIDAHVDSTGGELVMELGHLENPEVTVILDLETARALFVEGNPQAGMQAFMAGKVKIQGDLSKLLAIQQVTPGSVALEVQSRIRDITE